MTVDPSDFCEGCLVPMIINQDVAHVADDKYRRYGEEVMLDTVREGAKLIGEIAVVIKCPGMRPVPETAGEDNSVEARIDCMRSCPAFVAYRSGVRVVPATLPDQPN